MANKQDYNNKWRMIIINKLKGILYKIHGCNKDNIRHLYQDKHIFSSSVSSSDQFIEDEKVYYYNELALRFRGTGFRSMERMTMIISIPAELIPLLKCNNMTAKDTYILENQSHNIETAKELNELIPSKNSETNNGDSTYSDCKLVEAESSDYNIEMLVYEDYLLRLLSSHINTMSEEMQNDKKDSREKARFYAQVPSEVVLRRNGCVWDQENKEFKLRLMFYMPLINGTTVNGKIGYRAIRGIMELIYDLLNKLDSRQLLLHIETYHKQLQIRKYLKDNNLMTFVANGSILPRDGDTIYPLKTAIPFLSPDNLKREITFDDGSTICGLGIPQGITVITGGGYSGKSTLLDALDMGIYNHLPGDGREFVITEDSALKIYAEDGRIVHPLDISTFFSYMPNELDIHNFSTIHASGSVSQAANIIEAIYACSKLLLIDEDRSATNFMIRDLTMRRIVKKEPIIPFTDRIRTLSDKHNISTILVIGGSSEYLWHADIVLLMEDYNTYDITKDIHSTLNINSVKNEESNKADLSFITINNSVIQDPLQLLKTRYLMPQQTFMDFAVSQFINIDRTHFIKIDSYITDVTHLTSIKSNYQMCLLAWILERLLTDMNSDSDELLNKVAQLSSLIKKKEIIEVVLSNAYSIEPWFEEVRPIEVVAAINRMRGINLINKD